MDRIIFEIREIQNGWLLSATGSMEVWLPQDMYFKNFEAVMDYLKVNEQRFCSQKDREKTLEDKK